MNERRLSTIEFVTMVAMLFAMIAYSIDAMLPALQIIGKELSPEDIKMDANGTDPDSSPFFYLRSPESYEEVFLVQVSLTLFLFLISFVFNLINVCSVWCPTTLQVIKNSLRHVKRTFSGERLNFHFQSYGYFHSLALFGLVHFDESGHPEATVGPLFDWLEVEEGRLDDDGYAVDSLTADDLGSIGVGDPDTTGVIGALGCARYAIDPVRAGDLIEDQRRSGSLGPEVDLDRC